MPDNSTRFDALFSKKTPPSVSASASPDLIQAIAPTPTSTPAEPETEPAKQANPPEKRINRATHPDYTKTSAHLHKNTLKRLKRILIELDPPLNQNEAIGEALDAWLDFQEKKQCSQQKH